MSEIKQEELLPIAIDEFMTGVNVPVDLFIKLSAEKFVLIAKAGQQTERKQLSSYQNKEIYYLWVRKSEYGRLAKQTVALAGLAVNAEQLSVKQKSEVLSKASSWAFSEISKMSVSMDEFECAKQVSEATVNLIERHNDLSALFESLERCSKTLIRHSMAVSVFSLMIGQMLGWQKKATLEKLSLGGLLHDIGKKALPPELLEKAKAQMAYEEMLHYESHPYKGMKMLMSLGVVSDDVISIVYEHHENAIGQGFPQKLRNVRIHPLARVVALADEFVNLTVKNPNCPTPKTPEEAIKFIEVTMGQPYCKDAFRALKRVIDNKMQKSA